MFTDKANTALAFVSLEEDGNRTFSFYRKPSADLLYAPEQIAASRWWTAPCATPIWPPSEPPERPV